MYKWYGINKSGYDMQKELFEIRKETPWLSNCKAECIRQAALDVDSSYKKFFLGSGYPKFKSKTSRQSFSASQSIRMVEEGNLLFFGNRFKFRCSNRFKEILTKNKIKKCTFIKNASGNYFASCLVDTTNEYRAHLGGVVGVDMGLSNFVTTSDGTKIRNPRFYERTHRRLARHSRRLSRKQKGSNNRNKQRIKLSKVYEKITNQRAHFLHGVINKLISENQTIVIENLNIKGMLKNRKLSKAIASASWGEFGKILEYKCKWYGRELIIADRFYASSKTCSNCGHKNKELKLSDRIFNCPECGLEIDRDINAAINLKNQIPGRTREFTPVDSALMDDRRSHLPKKLTLCEAGT